MPGRNGRFAAWTGQRCGRKTLTKLEEYYNKFNEEKRLDSRHGQVEYRISMKYIHDYIRRDCPAGQVKILDIGAGTGRYSIPLAEEGYDVTAVEPVQHNLGRLKQKSGRVRAIRGNALRLAKLSDEDYDLTLLFGPMYHLLSYEEKRQALAEAARVTKRGGILMAAYCMNEYSVVTYAFKEKHVLECAQNGQFTDDFRTIPIEGSLYDYVRLEDIHRLSDDVGLRRIKTISPDGPANYIRPYLNKLSEEEFECFVRYQMAVCEREDLLGAGAHTVDILQK